MPAVERVPDALVVLEGAELVIDIVMPGMFEAMLDMSIAATEVTVTIVLTCLVVKVLSAQKRGGNWAKRRARIMKGRKVNFLDERHEEMKIRYTPLLVDPTREPALESNVGHRE